MSLEQDLRDNLTAAAAALVVPPTKELSAPRTAPAWRRSLVFALTGVAVVLALAIPIFLMTAPPEDVEPAGSVPSPSPTSTPTTGPATTTSPTTTPTTTAPTTTLIPDGTAVIGGLDTGAYSYVILAERGDGEAPTATLTLVASSDGTEVGRSIIGEAGSFFWHSVSGPGGVCSLTAREEGESEVVAGQLLLSPSLGCSDPYVFELSGNTLAARAAEAVDVATLFVEGWLHGSDLAMEALATPEAAVQAGGIEPFDVVFQQCEGAAGSLYCTWEGDGSSIVVRVSTVEALPRVTEFTSS
jgi:hypothetical protein